MSSVTIRRPDPDGQMQSLASLIRTVIWMAFIGGVAIGWGSAWILMTLGWAW
jgi:hypothetical protein